MYKLFIRRILFFFPPEFSHNFSFFLFRLLFFIPGLKSVFKNFYLIKDKKLNKNLFGLNFPNPVGLAAGFDKNAKLYNHVDAFGFSFVEIGTVTPEPQQGNPKPRLFRIKKDNALINRMGFNNDGVKKICSRLKKSKSNIIIGGNIGKNKKTLFENSVEDYKICFEYLFDYVDYFVLNVSSPNTPKLRELQGKEKLEKLILEIQNLNSKKDTPKPILIKISPDLNNFQLDDVIALINKYNISGLVATNSTNNRDKLTIQESEIKDIGLGGLTGKPINSLSTRVIKYIHEKSSGSIPIIAVGGIMSVDDALAKIEAGASLIQLYTGFVYEGPALVKNINKAILKKTNQ
jgi:dihydroorotate dehydrogenase